MYCSTPRSRACTRISMCTGTGLISHKSKAISPLTLDSLYWLLLVGSRTLHLDPVTLVRLASGDSIDVLRAVSVSPLAMIPSRPELRSGIFFLLSTASSTTLYTFTVKKRHSVNCNCGFQGVSDAGIGYCSSCTHEA